MIRFPQSRFRSAAVAIILVLGSTGYLGAEVVRFNFTGYVSRLTDPTNMLGGAVEFLDPVTGYFAYDTTASDTFADPGMGMYQYAAPLGPMGVSMTTIGGFTAGSDPAVGMRADVLNNSSSWPEGSDQFQIVGTPQTSSPTIGIPLLFQLALVDRTGTVLSSDALPNTFNLADWDNSFHFFSVFDLQGGNQLFVGTSVTSLTAAVPEPSSMVLLATGAVVVICFARNRAAERR